MRPVMMSRVTLLPMPLPHQNQGLLFDGEVDVFRTT
jgi:hypothetical protein